jgi:hypothetical protein
MADSTNLKTAFEELTTKIRETVMAIEATQVRKTETVMGFYDLMIRTEIFLRESSNPVYDQIYQVTNLLEDHIRSVYLFMDDATLEGHARELEIQLAQLRTYGDDIRSIAKTFNDEAGTVITEYMTNMKTTLDAENQVERLVNKDIYLFSPLKHLEFMERIIFSNQGFHLVTETLRDYKETCIKLLSIMAMAVGRWETKFEDRVDAENLSGGMIMSNVQGGGSISSKKGKRRQKDDMYL